MLGLPKPMNESTWYDYKARVHLGLTEAALVHLQDAAHQIRTTYADTNLGRPDDEGVLDVSVSIDGSWQKRGHQSHNGVVAVIEVFTGLVIDCIALSNYCRECETGPNAIDEGYMAWYTSHRPKCQKNKTLREHQVLWKVKGL